ncbi:MAG: MFS transporter, partial [Bacillota bacterium]
MKQTGTYYKKSIWNKDFILLSLTYVLFTISFSMTNPIISKYIGTLGGTDSMMGFVSGSFALTSTFVRPFSGQAVDRFNKRNVVLFSILMMAIANLGYAFSYSITSMILFRLIHGVGLGIYGSAALAVVSAALPQDMMGKGISFYMMGGVIALALGPFVSLSIIDSISYMAVFLLAAILLATGFIMCIFIDDRKPAAPKKMAFRISSLLAKEAILPASLVLINTMAYSSIQSFVVVYSSSRAIAGISWLFVVYSFTSFFTQSITGSLSDKKNLGFVLYPCQAVFCVALIIVSLAKNMPTFILAGILLGTGYGGIQPVLQAACVRSVPPNRRGVASSTCFLGI